MLNRNYPLPGVVAFRQRGVVLLISLIVLVVLSMAGLALLRSVDTTSIIAGNLAFRQAAVRAADVATEMAVNTLLIELGDATLKTDNLAKAYVASMPLTEEDPVGTLEWENFWNTKIAPLSGTPPKPTCVRCIELPIDSIGNKVAYTIQRMCQEAGEPSVSHCVTAPISWSKPGSDLGLQSQPVPSPPQYYYRITTRVVGPRNTTVYAQTAVVR